MDELHSAALVALGLFLLGMMMPRSLTRLPVRPLLLGAAACCLAVSTPSTVHVPHLFRGLSGLGTLVLACICVLQLLAGRGFRVRRILSQPWISRPLRVSALGFVAVQMSDLLGFCGQNVPVMENLGLIAALAPLAIWLGWLAPCDPLVEVARGLGPSGRLMLLLVPRVAAAGWLAATFLPLGSVSPWLLVALILLGWSALAHGVLALRESRTSLAGLHWTAASISGTAGWLLLPGQGPPWEVAISLSLCTAAALVVLQTAWMGGVRRSSVSDAGTLLLAMTCLAWQPQVLAWFALPQSMLVPPVVHGVLLAAAVGLLLAWGRFFYQAMMRRPAV